MRVTFELPTTSPLDPKFRFVDANFEDEKIAKEAGVEYRRQLLDYVRHMRKARNTFYTTLLLKNLLFVFFFMF